MAEENTQAVNRPLISVIVPAWNAAESIGIALDSLRRQTYDKLQVIVCNDGSQDDTGRIVRTQYPEVIYLEQENTGPSTARNRAVQSATGDLLAFVDTDDEWTERYAARMVQMFEEHPEVGVVGCNAMVRAGTHLYPFCLPSGTVVRELNVRHLMRGIRPPGPAVIIRTEAFREVGGFDTSIVNGADVDLLCRLVASGHRLMYTTEALYLKTEHSGNVTARNYSVRSADHLRGFLKMDPRRDDVPWQSPLTGSQYSGLVSQEILRGAWAASRGGKRDVGRRCLEEIRALPAPSLAMRVTAKIGQSIWPLFGPLVLPYYLYSRAKRAIGIWGLFGLARQAWRRFVG